VNLLQQLSGNQESSDPVVQLELAFAWMTLGHVQGLPSARNLGDPERAAHSYTQAIALAERAHASHPQDALPMLVTLYASAARVERSRGHQIEADALGRKLQGLLPALEQSGPSNNLAYAYSELAYLATAKDREAAVSLYQRAVETYSRVADPDLPQKAFALKRWGALLLAANQLEAGIDRYQQALTIERAIDVTPFDLSYTLSDLGLACRRQKRFAEAERYYREALAIREHVAADDPADVRAASALATIQWRLGWVFADAGRPEEAVPWGRRGVKLSETLANSAPQRAQYASELAISQVYLAEFLVLAAAKASETPKSLPMIARQIPEVRQLLQAATATYARSPDPNLAAELAALGVTLPDASNSHSARMTSRR
jgi:tetratricopeptide (TPR) repeat protein